MTKAKKSWKKMTKAEKDAYRIERDAENKDRMNEALAKVLDKLESGDPLNYIKNTIDVPEGVKLPPCWGYSFLNRLIIAANGTSDARTFKQWRDVGRKVIKGERAHIFVYEPVTILKKVDDESTTFKPIVKDDGIYRAIVIGFKLSARFAIEQTDGDPVDTPVATVPEFPMIEVARRMGLTIEASFFAGREYGSYSPADERIILKSTDATTFYHEVGHHLHGAMLKAEGKSLVLGQDEEQEIIAELIGGCLANINGVAWKTENIAAYIKNYNGDTKRVTYLFPVVEAAINLFTEKAEEFGLIEHDEAAA